MPVADANAPPDAPRPRCRPFDRVDALALSATAALELYTLWSSQWPRVLTVWKVARAWGWVRLWQSQPTFVAGIVVVSLLLTALFWTPAYLVVRLRRPRPPLRGLIGQPGMAALGATLLVLLAALLRPHGRLPVVLSWVVVPAAWAAVACLNRRNAEAGWVERVGVGVGLAGTLNGWVGTVYEYWIISGGPDRFLSRPWL